MILLSGASGFLGQIIKSTLANENIISIGRSNTDITANLSKEVPVLPVCDTVIHAAAKAHVVPRSSADHQDFFSVNVTGTANLLIALENAGIPKSFIYISSVSVYGLQTGTLINEDAPLLAKDSYGKSKIEAEKLISAWCRKHNVICTILRLPLIAGINPTGNLRSMINGIKKGYYFNIGNGTARKSIVLAQDVAKIIPVAAGIGGIYNLTDGYHPSFFELSVVISKQLGKSKPLNMPMWLAKVIANVGDIIGSKAPLNSKKLTKITSDLTFDDSKAQQIPGWNPTPVLEGFKIK